MRKSINKKYVRMICAILAILSCFFCSSCKKESVQNKETEEAKMAESHEIVDFELFAKIKKGMTYEKVTEILQNPGEPSSRVGQARAYRLKDDLVALIEFSYKDQVVSLRIEPLISIESFKYVVNGIEKNGEIDLSQCTPISPTTGIRVGSGLNIREYYLSDGRIVNVTYDRTMAVKAEVVSQWFYP